MDYTELLTEIVDCLKIIASFYGVAMILGISVCCGFLGCFIADSIIKTVKKRKEYKEKCAKNDK